MCRAAGTKAKSRAAPMAVTEQTRKQMSATPACTMERVEMAAASCLLLHVNISLSNRLELAKISNMVVYGVGVGVCESVSVCMCVFLNANNCCCTFFRAALINQIVLNRKILSVGRESEKHIKMMKELVAALSHTGSCKYRE